jgi:hypothetical protein
MRNIAFCLIFLFGGFFFSCKKPTAVPLSNFKNIYINGNVNVTIASGSSNSVTNTSGVTVNTAVIGSSLIVNGYGSATISINNVDTILLNEGSTITNSGTINVNRLYILCNGTGSFTLNNLNAKDSMIVFLNGPGTYSFSGSTNLLRVISNSIGLFSGYGLNCTSCYAFINNSGSIQVSVSTFLSGVFNGNGNVYYKGNPMLNTSKISGTGQLIKQ